MAHGTEYLQNPDFAEFDPRTLVPKGWDFRVHDTSVPLRDRWLSHYRIGSEERAGLGVLAPATPAPERGIVGEALGQWFTLPPHEPAPTLSLGLGLVAPEEGRPRFGDFRVLVESESGHLQELFWGRLDNAIWRDLELSLARYAGQTIRVIVENLANAVLLVDYARASGPIPAPSRWRLGSLTVEVLRADPFLIEADALLNEIAPGGDGPNRLVELEGDSWASRLTQGAPHAYGEIIATDRPLYAKVKQALHLVTLTEHSPMRRSILHRAVDDCLRTVRRDGITSVVTAPLLLGTQDFEEAGLFARDLVAQLLEWYRTFHPRQFVRFSVATLFEPLELHDLYHRIFAEAFEAVTGGRVAVDPESVIRLAGMANLVKTAIHTGQSGAQTLTHIEELLDAMAAAGGEVRATLGQVLQEAGLSEKQMLDELTASYRHSGRLDDRAMLAYERLHELDATNIENTRAMASAYRCRFLLDGERTRNVYEQVFRADAGDDENNRFLAAHYILAGSREAGSMRTLVFDRVGLGPNADTKDRPQGPVPMPTRPLPAASAFLHPQDRQPDDAAAGRSVIYASPLAGTSSPAESPPAPEPHPTQPEPASANEPPESLAEPPPESEPPQPPGPEAPVPEIGFGWQGLEPPVVAEPSEPAPVAPPPPAELEPDLTDTDQLLQRLAAEVQKARNDDDEDPKRKRRGSGGG